MKALLVCPEYPDTFWSFKHALRFVSKGAGQPPLGLLTVAAMLPSDWEKRLVDENVRPLTASDLAWADHVFLGGMAVQAEAARRIIARCNEAGVPVVAGGPLFTARHQDFTGVDHFVLNEAELTLPAFLEDLRHGRARPIYTTDRWADLTTTPRPMWELVDPRDYATLNIQYSRGCPFDCEFCDITVLFGRVPRAKSTDQVIAELDAIHRTGWRGHVFFVDDNFIGNRRKLKAEVLPRIIRWMGDHGFPFSLGTEASLDLADDPELLDLMARAGFEEVFVGIETPHEESLEECRKIPNRGRDLVASVRRLQRAGLQVQAGFIIGFDSDPPTIFATMTRFIEGSGIAVAMVGLLNAPVRTRLHDRLGRENRLLSAFSGNNTDFSMNFVPRMDPVKLARGYRSVLRSIYAPRPYYRRVKGFLRSHEPAGRHRAPVEAAHVRALVRSMLRLGVVEEGRLAFWGLFFWTLARRPRQFSTAITLAIYGFHFRRVYALHA
ncbi:MAG: B12-binding domain-containing radical SAM protein [Anaeromyxobacteraceae bacterium]